MTENTEMLTAEQMNDAMVEMTSKLAPVLEGARTDVAISTMCAVLTSLVANTETPDQAKITAAFVLRAGIAAADIAGMTEAEIIAVIMHHDAERNQAAMENAGAAMEILVGAEIA